MFVLNFIILSILILFINLTIQQNTFSYKCGKIESKKGSCAQLTYYNENSSLVKGENTVILDSDACDYKTSYCNIAEISFSKLDATCEFGNFSKKPPKYFGEACDSSKNNKFECEGTDIICVNNICSKDNSNQNKNEEFSDMACNSDVYCPVGMFCNSTTLICNRQLEEKASCNSDWECLNTLGCFNHVCTKYRSLAVGTTFTYEIDGNAESACIYGLATILDSFKSATCQKAVYRKGNDISGSIIDPPRCAIGTNCIYFIGDTEQTWVEPCPETYSTTGFNYCPDKSILKIYSIIYFII